MIRKILFLFLITFSCCFAEEIEEDKNDYKDWIVIRDIFICGSFNGCNSGKDQREFEEGANIYVKVIVEIQTDYWFASSSATVPAKVIFTGYNSNFSVEPRSGVVRDFYNTDGENTFSIDVIGKKRAKVFGENSSEPYTWIFQVENATEGTINVNLIFENEILQHSFSRSETIKVSRKKQLQNMQQTQTNEDDYSIDY